MSPIWSSLIHDTVALITIINPIAAASIMVSIIGSDASSEIISDTAKRATITVLVASIVTLFFGEMIFRFFGINVMSIKVIGGILLLMIAINMASGHGSKTRHTEQEHEEAKGSEDISVVPLGIPILFGPGMIATIIVLERNNNEKLSDISSYGIEMVSIFIAGYVTYLVLKNGKYIHKALGVTGMKVLTRIMGLVVGAIASQFIISGVKGLWG